MATFLSKLAEEYGLEMVDATEHLTVNLTKTDVKSAFIQNPEKCGFARACKRQNDEVVAAYFFRCTAWIETRTQLIRYQLPPSVQKEIVAFDRDGTMEPGEYSLSPYPKRKKLGKRQPRSTDGDGKITDSKKSIRHQTTNIRKATDPNK